MSSIDFILNKYRTLSSDSVSKDVPKSKPVFEKDKARSAVLTEERRLIKSLMESLELDDSTKEMISVNYSTSAVSRERTAPSYQDKVEALWNYWKFLEIINFHGGPLAFSDCHKKAVAWKYRPNHKMRQLVLMARGHLKSTLFCVGYVLWRIYQNPNIRIAVGTANLKLSRAFIREVEDYLTNDFNVEHVWNDRPHFSGPLIPSMDSTGKQRRLIKDVANEFGDKLPGGVDKKKVWRQEALQVIRTRSMKEPTLVATSVGQTNTGFHNDDLILDDVHDYDNTSTENKIDKVFAFVYDMESVLDPPYVDIELATAMQSVLGDDFHKVARWCISGGRITVNGTRWDDQDYYGHILEHEEKLGFESYQRNLYANGTDDKDGYLWPEKWNTSLEEQTRAQLALRHGAKGLQRFYSQYLNKIVNTHESVMDWDKIKFVHPNNYKLCEDGWVEVFDAAHRKVAEFKPYIIIDPTATGTSKSDFCCILVGGKHQGHLYVCDWWMKQATPQIWIDRMWEMVFKWNKPVVHIEMVGGFNVLEHTITQQWQLDKSKRPIAIRPWPTNSGQGAVNKLTRIETVLSPIVFNGMLHLPLVASRDDELRKQFLFFGKATTKDDGPDTITALDEIAIEESRLVNNSLTGSNVIELSQWKYGGVDYDTQGYGGVSYA